LTAEIGKLGGNGQDWELKTQSFSLTSNRISGVVGQKSIQEEQKVANLREIEDIASTQDFNFASKFLKK